MLFAEGTYIKKGQTLFVIDPLVYRARVDKAKAQLNKARAQAPQGQARPRNVSVRSTSRARPASSNWTTPSLRTRAPRPTW